MNKVLKRILITIIAIVVIGSVAANGYYFGFLKLKNYYMEQGYKIAAAQVMKLVKDNGQVNVGGLILVEKSKSPTK